MNSYISGERKAGPERSRSKEKEREREKMRGEEGRGRVVRGGRRRGAGGGRGGGGGRGEKLGRKEGAARVERGGAYGGYVGPSWGQRCTGTPAVVKRAGGGRREPFPHPCAVARADPHPSTRSSPPPLPFIRYVRSVRACTRTHACLPGLVLKGRTCART